MCVVRNISISLRPIDEFRLSIVERWLEDNGEVTGGRKRSAAVRAALGLAAAWVQNQEQENENGGQGKATDRQPA